MTSSSFAVTIDDVIFRVSERMKRSDMKNERLLVKYREKVNKHLHRMSTPSINIFFKYGDMAVLKMIVTELEEAGFKARAHSFSEFGSHLYIDLP